MPFRHTGQYIARYYAMMAAILFLIPFQQSLYRSAYHSFRHIRLLHFRPGHRNIGRHIQPTSLDQFAYTSQCHNIKSPNNLSLVDRRYICDLYPGITCWMRASDIYHFRPRYFSKCAWPDCDVHLSGGNISKKLNSPGQILFLTFHLKGHVRSKRCRIYCCNENITRDNIRTWHNVIRTLAYHHQKATTRQQVHRFLSCTSHS